MHHLRLPMTLSALALAAALATVAATPPRISQALAAQQELIAAEPGNAEALNDFGNLLALAGDVAAAEDAYRRALELEPGMVNARYNLALVYQQQGRLNAAEQALRQVLDGSPEHAWAWYQLGATRELRGRQRPAVAAYIRAFELDPLLSFSDVNPQVIDSKLTGKALLLLEAERSGVSEAPRSYSQPAHVAGLLLPPPPTPEEIQEEESRRAAALHSGGLDAPAETVLGDDRRPEVKILTLDDLERGSRVGEATPPAGAAPAVGARERGRPQVGGAYRPGSGAADDGPAPWVREGSDFGTPTTGRVQMRRDDG